MVGIAQVNVYLRVSAVLFYVLTACLVGLDSQTKIIFFVARKATYRDLEAFGILVYVDSAAVVYNLLQLCKGLISARFEGNLKGAYIYISWIGFLLDQLAAYITFAANSAAFEASVLAVTGAEEFQWMKLCNRFTRFCFQMGGALLCGYVASILMALISFISAYNLFSNYSSKRFLRLKKT
ncbi:CASP-like protein 2C1 [Quercus robur]|uniref:CASP-like protein 2C1 n=1 Tax=Quercus robur TaxID=38942 RepID=UPI0021623344|nr:CASP-like protein 2C1 [Quercus robur]